MTVTIDDVRRAASVLDGVVVRTPALRSDALDERVGAVVHLKAECLQRGGAFKLRGAFNKISSIPEAERAGGIVAVSSGNHAIAVALSAQLLGTTATILLPNDAPAAKVDVVRRLGAEIVTFDRFREDRDAVTEAFVAERGLPFVPPFDDPAIVAGQGTCALELFEQVGPLDALVVHRGRGGVAGVPDDRRRAGGDGRHPAVAGRRRAGVGAADADHRRRPHGHRAGRRHVGDQPAPAVGGRHRDRRAAGRRHAVPVHRAPRGGRAERRRGTGRAALGVDRGA
jgi:hypothetical protein